MLNKLNNVAPLNFRLPQRMDCATRSAREGGPRCAVPPRDSPPRTARPAASSAATSAPREEVADTAPLPVVGVTPEGPPRAAPANVGTAMCGSGAAARALGGNFGESPTPSAWLSASEFVLPYPPPSRSFSARAPVAPPAPASSSGEPRSVAGSRGAVRPPDPDPPCRISVSPADMALLRPPRYSYACSPWTLASMSSSAASHNPEGGSCADRRN